MKNTEKIEVGDVVILKSSNKEHGVRMVVERIKTEKSTPYAIVVYMTHHVEKGYSVIKAEVGLHTLKKVLD